MKKQANLKSRGENPPRYFDFMDGAALADAVAGILEREKDRDGAIDLINDRLGNMAGRVVNDERLGVKRSSHFRGLVAAKDFAWIKFGSEIHRLTSQQADVAGILFWQMELEPGLPLDGREVGLLIESEQGKFFDVHKCFSPAGSKRKRATIYGNLIHRVGRAAFLMAPREYLESGFCTVFAPGEKK
jgi:hypothetical protein